MLSTQWVQAASNYLTHLKSTIIAEVPKESVKINQKNQRYITSMQCHWKLVCEMWLYDGVCMRGVCVCLRTWLYGFGTLLECHHLMLPMLTNLPRPLHPVCLALLSMYMSRVELGVWRAAKRQWFVLVYHFTCCVYAIIRSYVLPWNTTWYDQSSMIASFTLQHFSHAQRIVLQNHLHASFTVRVDNLGSILGLTHK